MAPTSHAVVFSAFSCMAAWSLYHLWSTSRAAAAGAPPSSSSAAAAAPPAAPDHGALLALLAEVRLRVEAECLAVSTALSLAVAETSDPPRAAALREHARARVQAALAAAQAAALAARGLSEAQAERALAYWEGPGRSAEVAAAAAGVRAAAGEWVLSQARVLRLLEGFFEARAEALVEAARAHAEAHGGGAEGARRFQGFDLSGEVERAQEAGAAFLVERGGVSLERLQALLQSAPAYKVRAAAAAAALSPRPPPPFFYLPSHLFALLTNAAVSSHTRPPRHLQDPAFLAAQREVEEAGEGKFENVVGRIASALEQGGAESEAQF
jgi:hypothetical protein